MKAEQQKILVEKKQEYEERISQLEQRLLALEKNAEASR